MIRPAIAVGAAVLGVVAYRVQVDNLDATPVRALTQVVAALAFVGAGLLASARRPANAMGVLMIATGYALLARQLRYSHDELVFTTFFALGELGYALFAHASLAYPTGIVRDRVERAFVGVAYAVAVVFPLATLLLYDGAGGLRYFDPLPRSSLLFVDGSTALARDVQNVYAVVGYGVLGALFIALIARKLLRATPRARRLRTPLLLAAVVAALRAVVDAVLTFSTTPPTLVIDYVFWWQIAAVIALPIALVAGLLRARLAHASVGDLVLRLERAPVHALRSELSRAVDDPSLEVAFWLPERREFVDEEGNPVVLPADDGRRAVTTLEQDGEPVAALVHDPALLDEPGLISAAGAAARLALENARLHAELHAQLAKVKESRARIVAAGDEERRRIERNLHDGLQQRLVAIALEARSAQRRLGAQLDAEVEQLLATLAEETQVAVQELRELARGIHPAILSENGLAAALDSLAGRSALRVAVDATEERFAPAIEGTAYFVACEGLTNVVKHARATRAAIAAHVDDGTLVVEVVDDGVGGAHPNGGSGLRGLIDRVEAHGGRLRIESNDEGTRLVGEIPCA